MDTVTPSPVPLSDCCDAPTEIETYYNDKTYHVCTECGTSFCGYHSPKEKDLSSRGGLHMQDISTPQGTITILTRMHGMEFAASYDSTSGNLRIRAKSYCGQVERIIPYSKGFDPRAVEGYQLQMVNDLLKMKLNAAARLKTSSSVAAAPPKKEPFWKTAKEDPHAKNPF